MVISGYGGSVPHRVAFAVANQFMSRRAVSLPRDESTLAA
jgi:hypothetical protein